MSLILLEGFDNVATGQLNRKWTYVGGGISTAGRYGDGLAWLFNANGVTTSIYQQYTTASNSIVLGIAVSCDFGNATNPIIIFEDTDGVVHVDLRVANDGSMQVTRSGVVLSTTAPGLIEFENWNFIEFKCLFDSVSGSYTLKINGSIAVAASGKNTRNSLTLLPARLRLQPFEFTSNNYNVKFDDVYLLDGAGSALNDFIGECRIQASRPDVAGSEQDFVPKTGSDHVAMVSEQTSDDDTSYVVGNIANQKELFQIDPVSFTGTVYAVQVNATHKKDDVGVRTVAPLIKVSGNEYEGDAEACFASYKMARKIFVNNPATGSPWTISEINDMEFGMVIKS